MTGVPGRRESGTGSQPGPQPGREGAGGLLGAVLAGGGSRRFGRPKAVEPLAGRPMAGWAREALAPHARRVVVAGDPAVGEALGVDARADAVAGRGPLEGLRTALRWAEEEGLAGAFVLACDLPLVPPGLVGALVAASGAGEDAVVPASPGPLGLEPLCACYSARALAAVERALAGEGDGAVHVLLEGLRLRVLPLNEVRKIADPATAFLNVNTPEAAVRAGDLLEARGTRNGGAA